MTMSWRINTKESTLPVCDRHITGTKRKYRKGEEFQDIADWCIDLNSGKKTTTKQHLSHLS